MFLVLPDTEKDYTILTARAHVLLTEADCNPVLDEPIARHVRFGIDDGAVEPDERGIPVRPTEISQCHAPSPCV